MRYMSALLLLLISMPLLAANVWKWRDANGTVHYSDQPVPGAEQVTVSTPSTFTSTPATSSATSSASKAPVAAYTNVEIWKPSNEMTVANTAGQVSVGVRVEPALAPGHRLALYMDGRLVSGFPERGMEHELSEVDRGEHTLVLAVVDAQAKQVTASAPVRFFVQQPSVLRPR